ncbi:MAG: NAD-dependent epimerase/dehydratase family protein, partial [Hyphomicrobiaceae bacterium]
LLTLGAQREPYAAINLNIMGTVNVLETARVQGIKRVIVSSSSVLNNFLSGGEDNTDMMKEEAFPRPITFYAATKQAVESLGINYARHCGIEFAGLRYGAVFGPWSGAGGGGPSNMVRDAMRQALAGGEVKLPAAAQEWVYSKDAARGTVMALRAKELGTRIFIVTMGGLATPEDMAAASIAAVPGAKVRLEKPAANVLATSNARRNASLFRSRSVLGYEPQFKLGAAMQDLADFMRKHQG